MRLRDIKPPTCRECGKPATMLVCADDPLGSVLELMTCAAHQAATEDAINAWERARDHDEVGIRSRRLRYA